MTRLNTFMKDPRGSVLWTLDDFWTNFQSRPATLLAYLSAWAWGVEISPSIQFWGLTHFKKCPGSVIRIGKQCQFRSDFRSNMVGVNHPCGLSTYCQTAQIIIGSECGFSGTMIAAAKSICLGEHVLCGANVLITDFDWHTVGVDKSGSSYEDAEPVVIEDNVWIGVNSVVLKGSHIGKNSIIGANSLVTSVIPSNVVAGGIPARVIRQL